MIRHARIGTIFLLVALMQATASGDARVLVPAGQPTVFAMQEQVLETVWFRLAVTGSALGLALMGIRYRDRMRLSRADRRGTVGEALSRGPPGGPAADATTVLVIDDSADIRNYLRAQLEPRYSVLEASDGIEGLETVRERLPDLVICDLLMPGLNGIELCETMKADPELDFIPVLLVTANASLESRVEGPGTGADDYLTKPFNTPELTARVENLLESRGRRPS